jgi:hypothetical protein
MTPLAIATLLVFLLLPDGFAVQHRSVVKKGEPAPHGRP